MKTTIFIDNRNMGETPMTRVPLPPGPHKVHAVGPKGKTKDLKITIDEGELVVTGERKKEKAYKEADYYRLERFYGTFERHFPIPKTIDAKAVRATYAEGVLEIVLKGAVLVAEATKQEAKAIPVEVKTPALAAKA